MADNRVQKILTKRSGTIYDGMNARAKAEYQTLPFTKEQFRDWLFPKFSKDGDTRCEYSGWMILAETFQIDHRTPIDRAGSFSLDNLALCSKAENLRKGIMTKEEYLAFREYVESFFAPEVRANLWKKLEIGDVQRYAHFRRENKKRGKR